MPEKPHSRHKSKISFNAEAVFRCILGLWGAGNPPVSVMEQWSLTALACCKLRLFCCNRAAFPPFTRGAISSNRQRGETLLHHSTDPVWGAWIHWRCSCLEIQSGVEGPRKGQQWPKGLWSPNWYEHKTKQNELWKFFFFLCITFTLVGQIKDVWKVFLILI